MSLLDVLRAAALAYAALAGLFAAWVAAALLAAALRLRRRDRLAALRPLAPVIPLRPDVPKESRRVRVRGSSARR